MSRPTGSARPSRRSTGSSRWRAELKFAGKRVVATGRPYENSPYVQSVYGTHFSLESVKLAPGETPHEPEPTELLAPPLARTAAQAKAQDGWFAACVGTIQDGVLSFEDGGSMPVELPTGFFPITEIEGQQTLLAWVGEGRLHGRGNCAGVVPRCGMTELEADR